MPRICCIPQCKSNYRSEGSATISTFKFPKDEETRKKWLKAVSREAFVPARTSVVCSKHFSEDLILREDSVIRSDGSVLTVPRKIPKLASDAVPHIFLNQPACGTKSLPSKRKGPDDRRKECKIRDNEIVDYSSFVTGVTNREIVTEFNFQTRGTDEFMLIYKMDFTECPKIVASVKVFPDLTLQLWSENTLLTHEQFRGILRSTLKLEKWTQFDNLIRYFSSFNIKSVSINDRLKLYSDSIYDCAEALTEEDGKKISSLRFLAEQVLLVTQEQPRYSPDTVILSYSMFSSNSDAYSRLRNFNVLRLPHPKYLTRLTANLGTESPGLENSEME